VRHAYALCVNAELWFYVFVLIKVFSVKITTYLCIQTARIFTHVHKYARTT